MLSNEGKSNKEKTIATTIKFREANNKKFYKIGKAVSIKYKKLSLKQIVQLMIKIKINKKITKQNLGQNISRCV